MCVLHLLAHLSTSFSASASCPPSSFHTLGSLDLDEFTRATWYIQQQQITGYQPADSLYCVTATYNLQGAKVPFFSGTVASVYNYANEGEVNGKDQNAKNTTLCARAVDKTDSSRLAVAPCFLPNSLAGPYWVLDVGKAEGSSEMTWAVIIGGEPKESFPDGCTTTEKGVNGAGLWLFSRTPVAPANELNAMYAVLADRGVASSQLHNVTQVGCKYAGAFIKH